MENSIKDIISQDENGITIEVLTRASELLLSETDLEPLLTKMMNLVMAYSGAEKGVLLLKHEDNWFIQAQSDVKTKEQEVLQHLIYNTADSDNETSFVPENVFNYCLRTKEVLVLGDAQQDHRFSGDSLIQTNNIKSLACIPALYKGNLKAMLYIENCHLANVFSPKQIDVIKHLSSLFAISLENGRIYAAHNRKIQELKKSEARFRSVVENANETIVVTQDNLIKYSNPKVEELTGYSTEEMPLLDFEVFIHPDDLNIVLSEYQTRLSGEKPTNKYTIRIITKKGLIKYVSVNSALINWNGKPATLVMLNDITEQEMVRENLKQSEERFRNLMEQFPMAVEILTPKGKISQVNSEWKKLWNSSEEETAEALEKYNMLTDPQIKELGIEDLVKKAFSGQRVILPAIEYNPEITKEDFEIGNPGELRTPWIQCHLYPVKKPNGTVQYIVNTYVDITDLKKAEEESNNQKNIIARVSRTTIMGQLTASISHDLNQPLTGILSNAQAAEMMLKNGNIDVKEFKNILIDIINDAKRGGEVIRNLNQMYQKQKVEFLPFNLIEVISDTVQLLHSELVMKHIAIDIKYKSSILTLNGNWIQIQQVLVNLIMNSIQAMRNTKQDNSNLQILTSFDDNQIEVRVVDSGTGIKTDNIEFIFEPLSTWKPGGTGMGLAISNSIIKSHGGRMWAENRPEGGAIVGFSIPLLN